MDNWIVSSDYVVRHGLRISGSDYCLKLEGDQRLKDLTRDMQDMVRKNSWQFPRDEKEFVESFPVAHEKYYGNFDSRTEAIFARLIQAKPGSEAWGKIYKEQCNYDEARKKPELKDYPRGTLVCMESGAIASYVMHKCGIKNDFCIDVSPRGNFHAFAQSCLTANIIDPANKKDPYRENLSGGLLRNGKVAKVEDKASNQRKSYGNEGATIHITEDAGAGSKTTMRNLASGVNINFHTPVADSAAHPPSLPRSGKVPHRN